MFRGQQAGGLAMYSDESSYAWAGNVLSNHGADQRVDDFRPMSRASEEMLGLSQQMLQQHVPLDASQFQLHDSAFISQALERTFFARDSSGVPSSSPQKQKKKIGRRNRPNNSFNRWNVRLNSKICQVSESGDLWELLDLVDQHHSEMNIVNLSTILHRVARMAKKSNTTRALSGHPQMARLRMKVLQELEKGSDGMLSDDNAMSLPRCLATIAWSYATLQCNDRQSFQLIAKLATSNLACLKSFELANLLWSFAKVRVQANELFEAATQCIPLQLESFTPVSLSMVTWAFVTHSRPPPTLLRRLSSTFVDKLAAAKSQEIANMCWALATAKAATKDVFQVLGTEASRKLSTFNVQELSNTAWAFSRAGLTHAVFFEAMTMLFIEKPDLAFRFHGQALANMMWSLAKQVALGGGAMSKFQGIAVYLIPACPQVLDKFKPLEFSSMLWSIAKLGFKFGNNADTDRVFQAAAAIEVQRLNMLSPQGLTNVLYAFAEYINGAASYFGFLEMLAGSIVHRLAEFEVIGLLYVVESLQMLIVQNVPVANLQKLAFLVALEALKHTKALSPFLLDRLVTATSSLSPEMQSTIAQIMAVQGESAGVQKEDIAKLCRDQKLDASGQGTTAASQDSRNGFQQRADSYPKMTKGRAVDTGDMFAVAASQDSILANGQKKKTKGEPMFVQLSQDASRDDVSQKQTKASASGRNQNKGGKGKPLGRDAGNTMQTPPGELHGTPATRTSDQRFVQQPPVKNFVGQYVKRDARQLDASSWSEGGLERKEEDSQPWMSLGKDYSQDGDGDGNRYYPTDDERSEPSEYGDNFSNMRIVTPDMFGGSWEPSDGSSTLMNSSVSASRFPHNSEGPIGNPQQIAQQFGFPHGAQGNYHSDSLSNASDEGGKGMRGFRPSRLCALTLQRNPNVASAMAYPGIEECEEENYVSFQSANGSRHQSYQSDQAKSDQAKCSFTRPSWADEDPADMDITPLFKDWNDSQPTLTRED